MNWVPPQQISQQVNAALQWQNQKLQELENQIKQLQTDVENLNKQRAMVVDKIEYHFDQLKIDRLDGTLHIGVSPFGGKGSIEDFTVEGKQTELTTDSFGTDMTKRVSGRVERYLNEEFPAFVRSMEEKHQVILGQEYRGFIIQDIRSQVYGRIESYANSMSNAASPEELQKAEQTIYDKTIADVQVAIEQYLIKQKRKE